MQKPKRIQLALLACTLGRLRTRGFVFLAFAFLSLPLLTYTRAYLPASLTRLGLGTQTAYAATSDNLNFQARLETSAGAIAADGYYNLEFKLYDASTGGTLLWTETYYDSNGVTAGNDNRVRVANGYVTVNLGSQTAFPGTMPWDQQLYLTMNVGGTTQTATPTWDGEMNPRLKLTAVPYAFNAKTASELVTSSGANLATLSIAAPTSGNQTFVLQDQGAAGTYNIVTDGNASALLGGYFIQNQSATVQTGNINIVSAAAGTITVALQAASSQTADLIQFRNSGGTAISGINSSGELYYANSGHSATISTSTLTADRRFLLPDTNLATTASPGTICVFNGASSNCPAATGSAYYIQNQYAGAQDADYWLDGIARADTAVLTPSLDTAAAGTLAIAGTNATTVNIANNAAAHTVNIATGAAAQTLTIGSTDSTSETTINGGSLGITNNTPYFAIVNPSTSHTALSVNSAGLIQWDIGSNQSFQIRDNNSSGILTVLNDTKTVQTTWDSTLHIQGAATFSKGITIGSDTGLTYTTPLGANLATRVNIPNYAMAAYTPVLALGMSNCTDPSDLTATCTSSSYTPNTARVILVADARNTAHQPSIALLSPDENQIGGFSYDGSNTTLKLKNSSTAIALNVNGFDAATVRDSGSNDVSLELGVAGSKRGQLSLFNTANSNSVIIQPSATTSSYFLSLPTATGVAGQCVSVASVAASNQTLGYADCLTSTSGIQNQNVAQQTSANFWIQGTGRADTAFITPAIRAATDGTTAIKLQNSTGTTTALTVDTTNSRIGIGSAITAPAATLHVAINNSTTAAPSTLIEQQGAGDSTIQIKNANQSWYAGIDTSDNSSFNITSATAANGGTVLGNQSTGNTNDSFDGNILNAARYTAAASGTVSTLYVNIGCSIDVSPYNKFRLALYSGNATAPTTLLNQGESTLTTGWNSISIPATSVTSGQYYWIVYNTNANLTDTNCFRKDTSGGTAVWSNTYSYAAMPSTWPGTDTGNTNNFAFYAKIITSSTTDTYVSSMFRIMDTGQTALRNYVDSGAAFIVQNAAGTNVFTTDTMNQRVSVGVLGTPTGQLYVSGSNPSIALASSSVGITTTQRITVQGKYAYVTGTQAGSKVAVFDVSNPSSVAAMGTYTDATGNGGNQMAVAGRNLYAIAGSTVASVNITNPNAPASGGTNGTITAGAGTGIAVSGKYVYAGSGTSIQSYDVSNGSPTSLQQLTGLTGNATVVQAQGSYVYVGSSTNVTVVNAVNTASMSIGGTVSYGSSVSDLKVQGRYVYAVSSAGNNLKIYDVKNPAVAPVLSATLAMPTSCGPVAISLNDRFAYIACSNNTNGAIQIVSIVDPTAPTIVSYMNTPTALKDLFVSGRYLYGLLNTGSTFEIYDIGGAYIQQFETGAIETAQLNVNGSASFYDQVSMRSGLQVAAGAQINGGLGVTGGIISLNDSSNFAVNIGTGSTTAAVTIGNSANTTNVGSNTTLLGTNNGTIVLSAVAQTGAATGNGLTIRAGTGGTGNQNGGTLALSGGSLSGTGVMGLVTLNPTAFIGASQNCTVASCSITAATVDANSTALVNNTYAGSTVTLADPTLTTAGRVMYVTNSGTQDMTLSVNGGGQGNTIALKPNTTATMFWNGVDWTAAGASSATDLQAAYNNTQTAAGGAEIILRSTADTPAGTGGLTVRNNSSVPISGGLLEIQTSIGTNLFSVNSYGTELAANGGAETAGGSATTFPASTWSAQSGATVTRSITVGEYQTGEAGVKVVTGASSLHGVRNQLTSNPVASTTYTVSFTAASSTAGQNTTPIEVIYSHDNGTTLTNLCQGYGGGYTTSRPISNATNYNWTKVTCTITTTGAAVTTPLLIIRQTDSTARTIYIDNLSFIRNDSTTRPANVQMGGGNTGGQVTLFTLDRSSTAPLVSNGDDRYIGSMYYDTTLGNIQCYEADGWGACGSAPDNIVTFTPEYTGAVLNGSGVGTMTADFCGNGGGLSVNTGFCASGEARNYYKWTSPQATSQTYSVYVAYKLPSTFKTFVNGTTSLTGLVDSTTNAGVSYTIFRKASGGGLSSCSASKTVVGSGTGSANTWTTAAPTTDPSTCTSFVAGDTVIVQITVNAQSNASAYVENLTFRYQNN